MKSPSLKTATMEEIANELGRRLKEGDGPHFVLAWTSAGRTPLICLGLDEFSALTMLGAISVDLTRFINRRNTQ